MTPKILSYTRTREELPAPNSTKTTLTGAAAAG